MGSSVSAILAILFMHTVETQALSLLNNIDIDVYGRYVDDIFLITRDREQAEHTLTTFNSVHPKIKFEIEFPKAEKTLSLLDFTVSINSQGETEFDFYKKPARSCIFMNGHTALPEGTKHNVIHNEKQRIIERCTSTSKTSINLNEFQQVLKMNGHNPTNINHQQNRRNREKRIIGRDTYFLPLPFISNSIDRQIRQIFKQAKLDIIPVYRNRNLRSLLNKRPTPTCNMTQCPLNNSNLCMRKNVVYEIQCNECNAVYIGSTIRALHYRVKEHLNQSQSPVYQHIRTCSTNISTRILTTDTDPKNLRIKEGLLIVDKKPTLNRREEESCARSLIQTLSFNPI